MYPPPHHTHTHTNPIFTRSTAARRGGLDWRSCPKAKRALARMRGSPISMSCRSVARP